MARDLIPPPSPAGRPAPDGTPNLVELPPDAPTQVDFSSGTGEPSQYRNRFGFIVGGLGGVVIAAAAVAAIVIATGGSPDEGLAKNWSSWQPEETTITAGPADIAAHIAPKYRNDDGKQLVNVTGGPLQVQGIKLDDVMLRSPNGDIHEFGGNAVMYTLSGLGPAGSITGGTPSTQRHRLVRREALELALYTFRYMPNVDEVVTELPPAPPSADSSSSSSSSSSSAAAAAAAAAAGQSGSGSGSSGSGTAADSSEPTKEALFYRPGDLKSQLKVPLGATIPAKTPQADQIPSGEAREIDALTLSNLFVFDYSQTLDGATHLTLDRPTTP
jgi:hypothetical protein